MSIKMHAITELATLRILPSVTPSNMELCRVLKRSIDTLTTFSGQPFSIYQQVEDAQVLYLIGHWESLEQHHNYLISVENLQLLDELKSLLAVESMYHASCAKSEVPVAAPVLCIARYYVNDAEGFKPVWATARKSLEAYTAPHRVASGWRLDGAEDQPELDVFTGYEAVEQHERFPHTKGWAEYSKIKEWVKNFDIKHAKDYAGELVV